MRRLPLVLTAAVAALSAAAASAAPDPVLDGKKVTSRVLAANVADPQQHLLAETVENPVDAEPTTSCVAPRCYEFPFVVKPAAGVPAKTPLSAEISWTLPTSRFWLVLMDVSKKTPVEKARCSTFYVTAGQKATLRVPSIKPGRYAIWVTVQNVVAPEKVTGTVAFPATHTVKANPAPFPADFFVNGCNM